MSGWLLSKQNKPKHNTISIGECGEIGTLEYCWRECKVVQSPWETEWRFFKKLKRELPYDPAIPLLGIHLKKMKTQTRKDIYAPLCSFQLY